MIINKINEKTISDIIKIKNPNETIFEIMKLFFVITNAIDENDSFNWGTLQTKSLNYDNIKRSLFEIQTKNPNKDIIDHCMNITFNFNDLKTSMTKISKNLVYILELIKTLVDFSVKKNMKESLQQTNINVSFIYLKIENAKIKFYKISN